MIQFDLAGPKRRYWLVVEFDDVSVCLRHPGFEVDVILTADIRAFYRVWLGRCAWSEVLHAGQVQLEGAPEIRARSRAGSHAAPWQTPCVPHLQRTNRRTQPHFHSPAPFYSNR